jgi:hypothetical protein
MKRQPFWHEFATKKAAEDAIRSIIDDQPFKMPFESELISDLIAERHYFCAPRGLRPTRFRKIPGYKAYSFEGDFSAYNRIPPIGWHPVSWTKCLKPLQTDWDRIVRAMRDRCEPIKAAYRALNLICESCGTQPSTEAHHRSPTFVQLTQKIRLQITDDDISSSLLGWDWFLGEDFTLPEGSRITKLFDEQHGQAALQALCTPCHNLTKKRTQ